MEKGDKHEMSPCLVSKQLAVFCKPPRLGKRQRDKKICVMQFNGMISFPQENYSYFIKSVMTMVRNTFLPILTMSRVVMDIISEPQEGVILSRLSARKLQA